MKTLIILALALFTTLAQAEVRETNEMREALTFVRQDTWIVFDIDNTVLEPTQTLGSDQWFDYMVKKLGSVDKAIEIWSEVQKQTEMQTVEQDTPRLIHLLQNRGYKVLALTARPQDLNETTERQLLSQGIRFERIISIGPGLSKGTMLANELRANRLPSRVVFIDDKEKHVHSVDDALNAFPLTHFEFRYGAADSKVKSFSPQIAEVELSYFQRKGILLTDEEAEAILSDESAL